MRGSLPCPIHRLSSLVVARSTRTALSPSPSSPYLVPSRSYERLPRRPPPLRPHSYFQALASQRRLDVPVTPSACPAPLLVPHAPYHNPFFLKYRALEQSLSPPSAAPPPAVFCVVELRGAQYKVVEDDLIMTDRLSLDVGSTIVLTNVLLMATTEHTLIGRPLIAGASVHAVVEEQCRTEKLLVFHKKRRKNHRKLRGYRDDVTILRITSIRAPPELPLPTPQAALPPPPPSPSAPAEAASA